MSLKLLHAFRALGRAGRQLQAVLLAAPKAVSFFSGSLPLTFRRAYRVFRSEGLAGVVRRAQVLAGKPAFSPPPPGVVPSYGDLRPLAPDYRPLVSVIVPSFNHAPYLEERLQSIYGQTYDHFEVILLDDGSSDGSQAILQSWADRYPERTRCHFNERNSGGVFHQWKKGLELAKGELVWIAESDDACSPDFLQELLRCFQQEGVRLAFARTEFVEGSPAKVVWTQAQYLHDLGGEGAWGRPFIRSANGLVKQAWAIKNVVPNVSGAVFRHPGNMHLFDDQEWLNLRLCGDWVFYLTLVRGGLVAYNPAALNRYRQHSANTSVNAQKEAVYYQEHEVVARRLVTLYGLGLDELKRQEAALYGHWCVRHGTDASAAFSALYDAQRALADATPAKPNVLMVEYAFVAGGGETFPIILANELAGRGYAVTLLNCRQQPTEPGVRSMVSSQVSVLELDRHDALQQVCDDLNISIVHTHHAWCDTTMAMWLVGKPQVKHVVTTHGMYETMTPHQVETLMQLLRERVDALVYTAAKNLQSLPSDLLQSKVLTRIDNALPRVPVQPVERTSLGIGADDFVLCLVSRAIPEKGWAEAVQAVAQANEAGRRRIVLLLIGEGSEYDRLQRSGMPDSVHLLGFQPHVRNYFAAADMGFLPTRFPGESAPLVLIDCLLAGRPMLASDIGEIRYMLDTPEGPAGELFALEGWQLNVEKMAGTLRRMADDAAYYQALVGRVPAAARKFEIDAMVEKYEAVYQQVLSAE